MAAQQQTPGAGPGKLANTAFGYPRDFLDNRFVYTVISPRARGLSLGLNVNPDKHSGWVRPGSLVVFGEDAFVRSGLLIRTARQFLSWSAADWDQSEPDGLVRRMPGHILFKGKKREPLSVGRGVRKPVVGFIGSQLLLLAAIGFHAPDLHVA